MGPVDARQRHADRRAEAQAQGDCRQAPEGDRRGLHPFRSIGGRWNAGRAGPVEDLIEMRGPCAMLRCDEVEGTRARTRPRACATQEPMCTPSWTRTCMSVV